MALYKYIFIYLFIYLFDISASKRGRQLLNEFFIYSEDITPSPGYLKGQRIFKMTAVALGPKILSVTRIRFCEYSPMLTSLSAIT